MGELHPSDWPVDVSVGHFRDDWCGRVQPTVGGTTPGQEVLRRLKKAEGRRDGSEVKSTGCSSRGPEFNSQQPHGGSQPPVMRYGAIFWPEGIHAGRAFIHKI